LKASGTDLSSAPCNPGQEETSGFALQSGPDQITDLIERQLRHLVKRVAIPNLSTKSAERKALQHKRWFRNAMKWRTGCEGRIARPRSSSEGPPRPRPSRMICEYRDLALRK
jgi:hypothetical protein